MKASEVAVKGIRQGLLITLGEGPWEERMSRLAARIEAGATFFRGGRAVLDVGERRMVREQIQEVENLLTRFNIGLWGLLSNCDETIAVAVRAGLIPDLRLGDRLQELEQEVEQAEPLTGGALVVTQTIRSGQRVEHPGDVVIIGDVHAGAEVVAGRHVIVWGRLHGVVHAGALGNEEAIVCALDLAPTQLRVAGHIARSPEEKRRRPVPEMAQVRGGRIEAAPWRGGREV